MIECLREATVQPQLVQLKKDGLLSTLVSTKLLDQLGHNKLVCVDYPRLIMNIYHYDRFYP